MANETKRLLRQNFKKELSLIQSGHIKEIVYHVYDKLCLPAFWEKSASSTGKNHPRRCCDKGGLVLHTKAAVWWGLELIQINVNMLELQDHLIATLLIHDLGKAFGDGPHSEDNHGHSLAVKMNEMSRNITPGWALIILGVTTHMGNWGNPKPADIQDPTQRMFCNLIHMADYCASRHFDEIPGITNPAKYCACGKGAK